MVAFWMSLKHALHSATFYRVLCLCGILFHPIKSPCYYHVHNDIFLDHSSTLFLWGRVSQSNPELVDTAKSLASCSGDPLSPSFPNASRPPCPSLSIYKNSGNLSPYSHIYELALNLLSHLSIPEVLFIKYQIY